MALPLNTALYAGIVTLDCSGPKAIALPTPEPVSKPTIRFWGEEPSLSYYDEESDADNVLCRACQERVSPEVSFGYKTIIIRLWCKRCGHCERAALPNPFLHREVQDNEYHGEDKEAYKLKLKALAGCESPIEKTLMRALWSPSIPAATTYGWRGICVRHPGPVPQHALGPYRVDIAFPEAKVAVECDGHEFHERTKEQAERDRKRDRYMQIHGWIVLRYTGREIHRDTNACAVEVLNLVSEREKALA